MTDWIIDRMTLWLTLWLAACFANYIFLSQEVTSQDPMMMMMINFINVSRPHSLGKSHTNLGTQLIELLLTSIPFPLTVAGEGGCMEGWHFRLKECPQVWARRKNAPVHAPLFAVPSALHLVLCFIQYRRSWSTPRSGFTSLLWLFVQVVLALWKSYLESACYLVFICLEWPKEEK